MIDTPQFRCTVCGQVGSVGRCCGLETREPINESARATMSKRPTPRTDYAFDAYNRRACGSEFIRHEMQEMERESAE